MIFGAIQTTQGLNNQNSFLSRGVKNSKIVTVSVTLSLYEMNLIR